MFDGVKGCAEVEKENDTERARFRGGYKVVVEQSLYCSVFKKQIGLFHITCLCGDIFCVKCQQQVPVF